MALTSPLMRGRELKLLVLLMYFRPDFVAPYAGA